MIWNVPNILTVVRMCLVPVFVALFMTGHPIVAGVIFVAASLTDSLDGHIARKYNQVTVFGKFMDPLADKLLVSSALICMVELGIMPAWVVIVIVGRDFIISGFRLVAAERGVVIAAGFWGKLKTIVQMVMCILLIFPFTGFLNTLGKILMWVALALTIISLADYMYANRAVLAEPEKKAE